MSTLETSFFPFVMYSQVLQQANIACAIAHAMFTHWNTQIHAIYLKFGLH